MADDIQPDQETYDRLIAAGESERTARAKAKSVAARKARGPNRASLQQGDGQALHGGKRARPDLLPDRRTYGAVHAAILRQGRHRIRWC